MIWPLLGCNDNHNPLLKSTFSAKNPEIRTVYGHHVYHHIPPMAAFLAFAMFYALANFCLSPLRRVCTFVVDIITFLQLRFFSILFLITTTTTTTLIPPLQVRV